MQTDRLAKVLASDLVAFNSEAKRLGFEPVDPKRPLAPPASGAEPPAASAPATALQPQRRRSTS